MIVEFSAEAERDLEQIFDYLATGNPKRAHSFVQNLRSKCNAIAANPFAFILLSGYESHGIRRALHKPYLIFYRVDTNRLVIIHILNGKRKYENILFEL